MWPKIPFASGPLNLFQIDVAVNAPEAGTLREFLANEEDTVTVGQDLVRMELGGAPSGDQTNEKPKEQDSDSQAASAPPSSQPEKASSSPKEPKEPSATEQEPKPKKDPIPEKKPESRKPEPGSSGTGPALGNRDERRV